MVIRSFPQALLLAAGFALSLAGCGGGGPAPVTLSRVDVTPLNPSIPAGTSQQFAARAVYSDGSSAIVTSASNWASSDTAVAVHNTAGLVQSLSKGTTTISATYSGVTGSAMLTVTDPIVTRVDVSPTNPSIPLGTSQQFDATAIYSDGSTQQHAAATWGSSSTSVATIDGTGLAQSAGLGNTTVTATYSGVDGTTGLTVTDAVLSSIQVTPANNKLAAEFSLQYAATGIYTDNSTHDLTTTATWSSSVPARADFTTSGSPGLVTAACLAPASGCAGSTGGTVVTATSGSVSGNTLLTVTNATLSSISVTPATPTIPKGTTQQFTATGNFNDNTTQDLTLQADWASATPAVASVGNGDSNGAKGFTHGLTAGSSVISATISGKTAAADNKSGNTTLTVSAAALTGIQITPNPASSPKTSTPVQFNASGTYSDGSTGTNDLTQSVTWSSSNSSVATISNSTGTPPLSPNTKGQATTVAPGTTTISAAQGSIAATATFTVNNACLVSMSVTSPDASVSAGRTEQFKAMGTYTDGSKQDITASVAWDSSDHTVATVSNSSGSEGLATTYTVSQATQVSITAAQNDCSGNSIGGNKNFTVTNAVPQTISVTPANASYPINSSGVRYTANEMFSDGTNPDVTQSVTWSSSDTTIATVSNAAGTKGQVSTTAKTGSATITATDSSVSPNIVGSTGITVVAATLTTITVTATAPSDGRLPLGYKLQYTANGHYADGTANGFNQDITKSVSWSVQNPLVASVSNSSGTQGVANGVATGSTTVIATLNSVTGNGNVIVTNATLGSLDVNPKDATIHGAGATLQYDAGGTFSDGSELDLTNQVAWTSSNTNAVTIDPNTGLATAGILPGSSTITASKGTPAVTGSTNVTYSAN